MAARMSAVIAIWKCGVSQASVMRRAMVFRMLESWTTSTSALAGASAAQPGRAAARSTSSATMRPSGPVPWRPASSSPRSFASRRASGEAFTRFSSPADCSTGCGFLRLRRLAVGIGGCLASALSLVFALRSRIPLFLRLPFCHLAGSAVIVLRRLRSGAVPIRRLRLLLRGLLRFRGDLLAFLADDRDRLPDLDLLALPGEDLQDDAGGVGLDLLGDLLRVELVERLRLSRPCHLPLSASARSCRTPCPGRAGEA